SRSRPLAAGRSFPYTSLFRSRYLTGHQEGQRILDARVVGDVDQALVDDLGACLGGDVRTQVRQRLADRVDVPGIPRHAAGVHQRRAATVEDLLGVAGTVLGEEIGRAHV